MGITTSLLSYKITNTPAKDSIMRKILSLSLVTFITVGCGGAVISSNTPHTTPSPQSPQNAIVQSIPLNDQLKVRLNRDSRKANIIRIKSLQAYNQLGGRTAPINFAHNDLVIVKGTLGCATGTVKASTQGTNVTFDLHTKNACIGMSLLLTHHPYQTAFAIPKHAKITPRMFTKHDTSRPPYQSLTQALSNPNQEILMLDNMNLTDKNLLALRQFKNLTHIHLQNNHITDVGLANLSHMTKLYQVFLSGNKGITDAGLRHLATPMRSRMQSIDVRNTHVSANGVNMLKAWSKQQTNQFPTDIFDSLIVPVVYQ